MIAPIQVWKDRERETRCYNCGWPIRDGMEYRSLVAYEGDKRIRVLVHNKCDPQLRRLSAETKAQKAVSLG